MLRYDHQERLTAKEAQSHVYFSMCFFLCSVEVCVCVALADVLAFSGSVRLEASSGTKNEAFSDSGFCSA
jgi:casein kinase II subunit alpha